MWGVKYAGWQRSSMRSAKQSVKDFEDQRNLRQKFSLSFVFSFGLSTALLILQKYNATKQAMLHGGVQSNK